MINNKSALEKYTPTKNPLASFAWFPPKVNFATKDREEKVILLLRQHWIVNVSWILAVIILLFVPVLAIFVKDLSVFSRLPQLFNVKIVIAFLFLWYLFIFGFAFTQFLSWYFNVYIVTDERVIDIDFYGILYKNISEAQLGKIQDISHKSVGTLALLFNYGDLTIQTAAELTDLEFGRVPNPSEVHKIISELLKEVKH